MVIEDLGKLCHIYTVQPTVFCSSFSVKDFRNGRQKWSVSHGHSSLLLFSVCLWSTSGPWTDSFFGRNPAVSGSPAPPSRSAVHQKDLQGSEAVIFLVFVYYSKRIQRKGSKGKGSAGRCPEEIKWKLPRVPPRGVPWRST